MAPTAPSPPASGRSFTPCSPASIIRLDTDGLGPYGSDTVAKIWQKGGGTRLMTLPPLFVLAIDAFLPHRLDAIPGPLFTTRSSRRLTSTSPPAPSCASPRPTTPSWPISLPTLVPDAIATSARHHGTSPGTITDVPPPGR
ncbi:hypothetical protein [Streptomyces monashensis]|uniref:hypothetical protein n=1 Tax=Streptomyces monashensis TaxID=1678012 RepID=UPI001160BC34|nr:hypothetical protein [Streptomyces monashensis]